MAQEAQTAAPQGQLIIRLLSQHPSHIWSANFVHDTLSNGRPYKILAVLDEHSCEALCLAVKPKMTSADVQDALYPLLLRRRKTGDLRSDRSSEFIAAALKDWLRKVGIKPMQIYPGSRWKNRYTERFNGTLRREVFKAECSKPPNRHRSSSILGCDSTMVSDHIRR
ncbi:MAG: DDE-type integrase/transposase/recombinase [Paracoccaceae bacterium]|nr:DDE-type integrase/transposase/recombinase [Paracoccaceae bacterium]